MKITDGKRTVEINIMTWNGAGCGPDWAGEYFNAGARCKYNDDGELVPDDDTEVLVTEL